MKALIYLLLISIISLFGCTDSPTNTNQSSILSESKTIQKSFDYYRDSPLNSDSLLISLESSNPDVYMIMNFYISERRIKSYSVDFLQIDTPITSVTFEVRQEYTKIYWTTAYEINNLGWEIQRKDSNQTYNTIAFVNGYGTSSEPHSYSFVHNINLSKLFFYRFKQIYFDGSFYYSIEAQIDVEAVDSINAQFVISSPKGVIKYTGEIAPDSGYTFNLQFEVNDLIYFKNSYSHYGRITLFNFNFIDKPFLNIDELTKRINYQLRYEVFLQTNGERTFY